MDDGLVVGSPRKFLLLVMCIAFSFTGLFQSIVNKVHSDATVAPVIVASDKTRLSTCDR